MGALIYAEMWGGKSTIDRFATLLAGDPLTVYQKSARLGMVTNAFDTLLVDYPLGAGLGRWGMMRVYFGDESNGDSPMIWSEVQFSSWVLDGGIVLLTTYVIAIVVAVKRLIRLTLSHPSWRSPPVGSGNRHAFGRPNCVHVQLLSVSRPDGHAILALDRGIRRPCAR